MSESTITVEAMKHIEQRWATAKDRASEMALYTDDAMFDNIGTQPVIGKDAVQVNYDTLDAEGEIEGRKKGQIATVKPLETG